MSGLRVAYLVFAVAGAVLPLAHWMKWLGTPGAGLGSLFAAWIALAAIPVTLGIGLGCGLPLYLFLRTRPVA